MNTENLDLLRMHLHRLKMGQDEIDSDLYTELLETFIEEISYKELNESLNMEVDELNQEVDSLEDDIQDLENQVYEYKDERDEALNQLQRIRVIINE